MLFSPCTIIYKIDFECVTQKFGSRIDEAYGKRRFVQISNLIIRIATFAIRVENFTNGFA